MRLFSVPLHLHLWLLLCIIGSRSASQYATATSVPPSVAISPIARPTTSPNVDPWSEVRQRLPHDIIVLRPTWLPAAITTAPVLEAAEDARADVGWVYAVGYREASGAQLYFALKVANSAPPTTTEEVSVRSVTGHLMTSAAWPPLQIVWKQNGASYIVQASGISRDELVRVVNGLAAVP